MKIGTYYYPEQWPREQWARDFDNIAKLGLQIVHMGEFAWFEMEPSPHDIRLGWLHECVEMAADRWMGVILCTPTAAPPVWLADRYPESLPVDAHGTRGRFGSRRHYTPTSRDLQEATWRIVTALGERFGHHPAVIGWQVDNEYGGAFDQSEQTHKAFRAWLRRKYYSVAELNRAWGCQFWNTYYEDFDQILLPATRNVTYGNPHQSLDASRFWSWAIADFNKLQTDCLKLKIDTARQWVTTNFMPFHYDCDPADMADDLTLDAWDSYPVTGWEKSIPDQTFRLADPAAVSIIHDQMASYHGRWGLMELQPGQVNWTGIPVQPYPGAVRLWIWTAFAHGAEFVTTYRYRQPRFGVELFHQGLAGPDGVTPTPGGRQFAQCVEEVARLDLNRIPAISRDYDPAETVGLVFDFEQLWYFATLPQTKRWDQPRWLRTWYGAVMRLGLKVKILRPGVPWPADLPLVVAPGVQMVDDALVARFDEYAAAGGHLLLTCRTGLMDRTGQLWEGPTARPILPLIGGRVDAYDGLPEGTFGKVEMDGRAYDWGVWGDHVAPADGTRTLARYADQYYAGTAAVTQRPHGAGTVTYCGVYAEGPLEDALVEKVVAQVGPEKLRPTPLPPRVQVQRRGPYRIVLNYQDQPVEAPAPEGAKFIVGERQVGPAGVAVWEEA